MKKVYVFVCISVLAIFSFGSFAATDDSQKLGATMTGAAEVPGPGDADASGSVEINLNQGQKQVCFELHVSNMGTATAAHIHEAKAGKAGPVVVTLTAPADGSSKDCVSNVSEDLIKRIRQNPENFYVNVHNAEFPNGALRGQLSKK